MASVLIVVSFSVGNAAITKVKMANNVHNLRQIGIACFSFASDHQGKIPWSEDANKQPAETHGASLSNGQAPRKLFSRSDWPGFGDGTVNYLESPDALYSPFAEVFMNRRKFSFNTNPRRIGYFFYYTLSENRVPNDNIRASPRAILYSDVAYRSLFIPEYKFTADSCSFLYMDGAIVTFPISEIDDFFNRGGRFVSVFAAQNKR